MKFLGQEFQKLEHERDRQTDRRDQTHDHSRICRIAGGKNTVVSKNSDDVYRVFI